MASTGYGIFARDEEKMTEAEQLAKKFHEIYERLAPQFSYQTREASAKPWSEVPDNNKNLMIAVCGEILKVDGLYKSEDCPK